MPSSSTGQVPARVGDDMGESQGRGSLRVAVTSRSETKLN